MHNSKMLYFYPKKSYFIILLLISGLILQNQILFSNPTTPLKKELGYSEYLECATNIAITRRSSAVLYINDDISPEKRGQYALYEIENTGTASIDAYVKVDNFVGDIRLGDQEDGVFHIGVLAPNEIGHAYLFFVTDLTISGQNGNISGTNTHTVNVFDGDPESGGILNVSEDFDIAIIEDVIKASANKVTGVVINGSPVLGSSFSISVTGETGTIGAEKVVNFTAATNVNWPSNAFKLTHSLVNFTKIGNGNNKNDGLTFENELNFEVLDTKNTAYEITYTYSVVDTTSTTTIYEPTAYISSGTQFKHSILDNGIEVPDIPATNSTLSGFVWSDDNYDGIKQNEESKMNGVIVRLLDSLGNELQSTTSSGTDGNFKFLGIESGNYQIRFDRNDRYVATKQDATIIDSLDSDMNRASRIVELTVTAGTDIPNITAGFAPDFDRDLIPDIVENAGSTSFDAVDPAGYFYDEVTGEILTGGVVQVTGPGKINIVDDGSATGYYSWLIDGTPGVYTMTVLPPGSYSLSNTRNALPTIDATPLAPDPYSVGSGDSEPDGFLDDFSAGANPYYLSFELAAGDPFIINNNIPLTAISLPVEISSFDGQAKDCAVNLTWTTESEINFDYFEIQQTEDGINFRTIGHQEGLGTSGSKRRTYYYTDREPSKTSYYRLKMIDFDGSFEFSDVIVVETDCTIIDQDIKVFPNPIGVNEDVLTIDIRSEMSKHMTLSIITLQSHKTKEITTDLESGLNKIRWDIADLPSGIYFLVLDNGYSAKKAVKFVKN